MNGAITKQSRLLVMFAHVKYSLRTKKIQLVNALFRIFMH